MKDWWVIVSSLYCSNLLQSVIDLSVCKQWSGAVLEWEITDCNEDDDREASCVCGKENLRYLFTIQNTINGNYLYPIGSSCIHKFERNELSEKANIQEDLFKLFHTIENRSYISLTAEFFTRKLLKYLFDEGAFTANEYNKFNPENDYDFMLKMFNKKNRSSITLGQQKKINGIIISSIKPYLIGLLATKIK